MFSNTFIRESIQLIINAIVLFEKGYFDAAFYSLRESLEVSTTTVYFVDDSESNRKVSMKKWKQLEKFPGQSKVLRELKERNMDFADVIGRMAKYFEDLESAKNILNKYVHKQGLDKFYVYRSHPFNKEKIDQKKLLEDFEKFLIKSIGAVAVFRLIIDPFPILLMDEDIFNRTPDLITEAYSEEFINKYIGEKYIQSYKETDFYIGVYESIMGLEKRLPAIEAIIKNQFVDIKNLNELDSQKHLLDIHSLIALTFFRYSNKIVKMYCIGGLHWYYTNESTKRTKNEWSSTDFTPEKISVNTPYDEVYLTYFNISGDDYYIEHNEKLGKEEIDNLNKELAKYQV